MKKIIGFQNKGGIRFTRMLEIYDDEIFSLVGKKGMRKIINDIKLNIRNVKVGKMIYYSVDTVLAEMQEIIDKSIMEEQHGI